MDEKDLLELILAASGDIDQQFEFWLSITFAVLIASHVWGARLNPYVKWLLATLYVFASAILYLRYLLAIDFIVYVRDLYTQYNVNEPPSPGSKISFLRQTLFIVGTIVTTIFVINPRAGQPKSDQAESRSRT